MTCYGKLTVEIIGKLRRFRTPKLQFHTSRLRLDLRDTPQSLVSLLLGSGNYGVRRIGTIFETTEFLPLKFAVLRPSGALGTSLFGGGSFGHVWARIMRERRGVKEKRENSPSKKRIIDDNSAALPRKRRHESEDRKEEIEHIKIQAESQKKGICTGSTQCGNALQIIGKEPGKNKNTSPRK